LNAPSRLAATLVLALGAGTAALRSQPTFDLGPVPGVTIECLSQSPQALTHARNPTLDGSWRQFRRDRQLTGRSPLVGNTTCPEVLWSLDLGGRKNWVSIVPGSGQSQLALPTTGEIGNHFQTGLTFEVDGTRIDLDGDGFNRVDPSDGGSQKVGEFRADLSGYERVSCDSGQFQVGAGGNDPLPCFLQHRQNHQWVLSWQTVPLAGFSNNMSTNGEPIVGDFDNDGGLDAAVTGWYDVYLIDLTNGTVKQTGNYQPHNAPGPTTGRPYGWFGAFDIEGDARKEFVILGDFEMFISVLGWRNGLLTELWDHQIEAGTFLNTAKHHPGVNPVADVDGDGVLEIVTSIFNEHGDQKWHVVGFDARNGTIEFDFSDRYLSGMGDLTGDGFAEMLLTTTSGQIIPEYGNTTVVSRLGNQTTTLWSSSTHGFQIVDVPGFPDTVNSRTTYYRRSAFLRSGWTAGPAVFITREPQTAPNVTLRIYQWSGSAFAEIASAAGPRLDVVSFPLASPQSGILLRSTTLSASDGPLSLSQLTAHLEFSGRARSGDGDPVAFKSLLTSTVVGPLAAGARPSIVTQDYLLNARAYDIDLATGSPRPLWTVPGRGMTSGDYSRPVASINGFGSLLIADLLGTGSKSVVVAGRNALGQAVIRALDAAGSTVWETAFGVPGAPPIWNEAGITNWIAGHFTTNAHEDIIVSLRTAKQASDHLYLLNGTTGAQIWERSFGGAYSGCSNPNVYGAGGSNMPTLDFDGDGLDDILNTLSSLYVVYKGNSGAILINRWATDWCPSPQQLFSQGFLEGAIGVVADFLGNGTNRILYGKNEATMALLGYNGNEVWHTPFYNGMHLQALQGVGDFDGDGKLDILVAGQCGTSNQEIRKYSALNGTVQWTFPLPTACGWPGPKAVVSGDLDGDGRDEALIMDGNVLHAIGETAQGQGVELWRATFEPANGWGEHGDPIIADVDGTGRPQILVNARSGYLYALGTHRVLAPFTDPSLVAGQTAVKVQHVVELRSRVNALRVLYGLAPYAFTDPSPTAGQTTIKAVHVNELRVALNAVYTAASLTAPVYTDNLTSGATAIRAIHINELRQYVLALE